MKLHCRLDYDGNLPCFVAATDGKCRDLTAAKSFFTVVPDSIYCLDRGYLDFAWFRHIDINRAFFVTRAKENLQYEIAGQQPVPAGGGVLSDEEIRISGFYSAKDYPGKLRLVCYYDPETDAVLQFLTNNFSLAASTIANIYKARWQIEVFFKWIKQNLQDKELSGDVAERGDEAGLGGHVLLSAADLHKIPDEIPLFDILSAQDSAGNADGEDFTDRFVKF